MGLAPHYPVDDTENSGDTPNAALTRHGHVSSRRRPSMGEGAAQTTPSPAYRHRSRWNPKRNYSNPEAAPPVLFRINFSIARDMGRGSVVFERRASSSRTNGAGLIGDACQSRPRPTRASRAPFRAPPVQDSAGECQRDRRKEDAPTATRHPTRLGVSRRGAPLRGAEDRMQAPAHQPGNIPSELAQVADHAANAIDPRWSLVWLLKWET